MLPLLETCCYDMPGVLVAEECAFYTCCTLMDVECDKLEIIVHRAFGECTSLRSIDLPSVREIQVDALDECRALTSATFGNKLESIEESAFDRCISLEQITIPLKNSIITHDYIFGECDMLKHVDLVEGEALRETVAALQLEMKAEHRRVLKVAAAALQNVLPRDVVTNNILPFLELPYEMEMEYEESESDGVYDEQMEEEEQDNDNA